MAREDRLKEVYEYVRKHFPIHTQTDFADALKYNRAYISSAMHGNEKNLTNKLFSNICEAFPETFNLDYLLTGEGSLLANGDESNEHMVKEDAPPTDEVSSNILELYARMIRGVDDLRIQLKEQLSELQQVRDDLRTTTQRLSQALKQLNKNGNSNHIGIAADDGDN